MPRPARPPTIRLDRLLGTFVAARPGVNGTPLHIFSAVVTRYVHAGMPPLEREMCALTWNERLHDAVHAQRN